LPLFKDHIGQAKSNLEFLRVINAQASNHIDWQVTACFYTACHLVNAHLSHHNMQYRSHSTVKNIISPSGNLTNIKLPEDEYAYYESLFSLSRRARYLINDKDGNVNSEIASFTYDKHLAKAVRHLDKITTYFSTLYEFELPKIELKCSQLNPNGIINFKVLN
jgi:uncharacterized protein (UPF0332 family)